MQVFVAVIVALLRFLLQAHVAPYRRASDNFVAFIASAMLVLVLLGSLELQSDALAPTLHISLSLLSAVLFIATLVVILVPLAIFAAGLHAARLRSIEERQKNLDNGKRVKELLKMEGSPVHIISTPFSLKEASDKAEEIWAKYNDRNNDPPTSHCYNPNTDCDQAGEDGWMKTWMRMAKVTRKTGGKVLMVYNGSSTGRYAHGLFDGQAQSGELMYALELRCTIEWWPYYMSPLRVDTDGFAYKCLRCLFPDPKGGLLRTQKEDASHGDDNVQGGQECELSERHVAHAHF